VDQNVVAREYWRGRWAVGRTLFFGAMPLVAVVGLLNDGAPGWVDGVVCTLVVGVLGWVVTYEVRGRTVVGEDGIAVRGALRVRRWAWRDIHSIEVEELRDVRSAHHARIFLMLYDATGRCVRLPHVNDLWVDVYAEAAAIRAVWRAHRGTDALPTADAQAARSRRATQRAVFEDAFLVALCTLCCMFVLYCIEAEASLLAGAAASAVRLLVVVPVTVFVVAWFVLRRRASRDEP
jgi:hypothetical protein